MKTKQPLPKTATPYMLAWQNFKTSPKYARLISEGAHGVYLENRIKSAFDSGFIAAQQIAIDNSKEMA